MRLGRYLGGQLLAAIAVSWAVLWGLLWTVGFVEGLGRGDASWAALGFSLLASLDAGWQLLPAAVVVGLVFASSQLARNGELLALLAVGRPPRAVALPWLASIGLVATAAAVAAQHALPPVAQRAAAAQSAGRLRGAADAQALAVRQHWFRRDNVLIYVPHAPTDGAYCLSDPQFFWLANDRLQAAGQAACLRRAAGGWAPHGLHLYATGGKAETAVTGDAAAAQVRQACAALPADLLATHGHPKHQPGPHLRALIARREAAGLSSAAWRLEAGLRAAHPALAVSLAVVLLPWAQRPCRRRSALALLGGGAIVVAVALALGQLARQLAAAGVLPAAVAGWSPVAAALLAYWPSRRWARRL